MVYHCKTRPLFGVLQSNPAWVWYRLGVDNSKYPGKPPQFSGQAKIVNQTIQMYVNENIDMNS